LRAAKWPLAGEPEHRADGADHGAGDDRADAEQAGQAGARGPDRGGQLLVRLAQLGIEAAEAGEELARHLTARPGARTRRADLPEEAGGLPGADLLADAAGHQGRGTAGSRQQAWLRNRARSRCRLAHTFSTTA